MIHAPGGVRSLAALALVLVTTACSGAKSSDASSASSPADVVASAVASSADVAADSASAAAIDPCKKLGLADVAPFFTAKLSATHDDDLFGSAAGCWYHTPDHHTNLEVTAVTGAQAEAFYEGNINQHGETDVPLAGVGDKAVRRRGGVAIVAMKGNVVCMLYTEKDSRASLKGAEKYAGAPIPDGAAVPLARSLATLCTKLWQ